MASEEDRRTHRSEPTDYHADDHAVDRRDVLKGIGVAAVSVGVATAASDTALAAGDGYGQGGYGTTAYGGVGLTVSTGTATDVTATSATLTGELTDLGGGSSATCYFEWRRAGASTWETAGAESRSSTGGFSASLTGLDSGVEYEYRAAAETGDTATAGNTRVVTTTGSAPVVTTDAASSVSDTVATLSGSLSDLGTASSADCYFQWRPVGQSSWRTAGSQALDSVGSFSTTVQTLTAGTDYEYRTVADATDGETVTGETVTFSTTVTSSPPAIDSFSVSEAGRPDPHLEITAQWAVSDPDGDLDTVVVEVTDGSGALLDATVTEITGSDASLANRIVVKEQDGETVDVTLTVVDTLGNGATRTETVTE